MCRVVGPECQAGRCPDAGPARGDDELRSVAARGRRVRRLGPLPAAGASLLRRSLHHRLDDGVAGFAFLVGVEALELPVRSLHRLWSSLNCLRFRAQAFCAMRLLVRGRSLGVLDMLLSGLHQMMRRGGNRRAVRRPPSRRRASAGVPHAAGFAAISCGPAGNSGRAQPLLVAASRENRGERNAVGSAAWAKTAVLLRLRSRKAPEKSFDHSLHPNVAVA